MKHYIVLSGCMTRVAGSLLYYVAIMKYYEQKGYRIRYIHDVNLSAPEAGDIIIEYLKRFIDDYVPELSVEPSMFCRKKQHEILDVLSEGISEGDEVLIETNAYTCSLWGEMLAEHVKGKHKVFQLDENPVINTKDKFDFYKFKFGRGECFNISKEMSVYFFKDWMKVETPKWLPAYSANPVDDVSFDMSKIPEADYYIGSIGRLEKDFVYPALCDVVSFAQKHTDKRFSLVLIGGAPHNYIDRIVNLLNPVSNISYFITGTIFPIPLSLIRKCDVFLCTAGCCHQAEKVGKVVISFDVEDLKPIGIFNRTCKNSISRDEGLEIRELGDWLEDILIKKEYEDIESGYDVVVDNYRDFSSHDEALAMSDQRKMYYHTNCIRRDVHHLFYKMLISLVGVEKHHLLIPKIVNMKNNIRCLFK